MHSSPEQRLFNCLLYMFGQVLILTVGEEVSGTLVHIVPLVNPRRLGLQ